MKIEEIWNTLEKDDSHSSTGALMLYRRVSPDIMADLYGAVEKPFNRRSLILRVHKVDIPSRKQMPAAEGVTVLPIALEDGTHALMLRLENDQFKDVFAVLATDIIHATADLTSSKPVTVFLNRIRQWQKCLAIHGAGGLSKEEQQGLYGELYFLRELLVSGCSAQSGVSAWVGQTGAVNDFQFENCSVEVKTASSKKLQELTINGLLQLDERNSPDLYLFHLSVDLSQTVGETLNEVVMAIRTCMSNEQRASDDFNEKLIFSGYIETQADKYLETKYRFREKNIYQVFGDFPRVREGELRVGVGSVEYRISVAACAPYRVAESDFMKFIAGAE